jgi:carbon storage regulator
MLTVTRKVNERIHINDDIVIEVLDIKNKTVRIGVSAPAKHLIFRGEIYEKIIAANQEMVVASFTETDVKTFLAQKGKK